MRINPITARINFGNTQKVLQRNNIQYMYATATIPCDSVCFKGSPVKPNTEALKKLSKYGVPDMYTGRLMFHSDVITDFINKGLFDKSIKEITAAILPYRDMLQDIEQEVFAIIEQEAKKNPNLTLSDTFKKHSSEKCHELHQLQEPIFKHLEELAKNLPEAKLYDFQELMTQSKAMLQNKSILKPFSKTDFRYKLKRFADDIKLSGNDEENEAITRLIKMAEKMPHTPKKNGKPVKKYCDEITKKQEKLINSMIKYYDRTRLAYNQDLRNLFTTAKNQINGIPTYVQFSRKPFIHELNKIIQNVDDPELVNKMRATAAKLPTSMQENSAFIVKFSRSTSEKIGISLLRNSVVSIEHLKPSKLGGEDEYANYGLSASITNSLRGCMSMEDYLHLHPEAYKNCQKYVDKIIELTNRKILRRLGVPETYIIEFVKTMKKLSPKEKPMILDLSALDIERLGVPETSLTEFIKK